MGSLLVVFVAIVVVVIMLPRIMSFIHNFSLDQKKTHDKTKRKK